MIKTRWKYFLLILCKTIEPLNVYKFFQGTFLTFDKKKWQYHFPNQGIYFGFLQDLRDREDLRDLPDLRDHQEHREDQERLEDREDQDKLDHQQIICVKKIPLIMEIITFVVIKIEKSPYWIANRIVQLIQSANFGHFVNQNKEGTKGSASWKPKEIMLQRMQILHLGPKIVICPIQGQVCHQERCILGYPNIFGLTVFNFSKKNSNLLFIYVILVVFQKFQKFFFRKIVMSINYATKNMLGDPSEFQLQKYLFFRSTGELW